MTFRLLLINWSMLCLLRANKRLVRTFSSNGTMGAKGSSPQQVSMLHALEYRVELADVCDMGAEWKWARQKTETREAVAPPYLSGGRVAPVYPVLNMMSTVPLASRKSRDVWAQVHESQVKLNIHPFSRRYFPLYRTCGASLELK